MRVVDEDRRAVVRAGQLQPSLGAAELSPAPRIRARASLPVAIARPAATAAFCTWKAPTSGSLTLYVATAMRDGDDLREAVDRAADAA